MTDPVVRKCLDQIRLGCLDAALVLADYVEENFPELNRRGRMRKRIDRWLKEVRWDAAHDFSKNRRWTYWESVGARCRTLWEWFKKEFDRKKWKWPGRPKPRKFSDVHRELFHRNEKLVARLAPRVLPNEV
jgi:hypothetical protein